MEFCLGFCKASLAVMVLGAAMLINGPSPLLPDIGSQGGQCQRHLPGEQSLLSLVLSTKFSNRVGGGGMPKLTKGSTFQAKGAVRECANAGNPNCG